MERDELKQYCKDAVLWLALWCVVMIVLGLTFWSPGFTLWLMLKGNR